ncbi:MAG: hypothetical protein QGG58_01895 [Chloroflexota bacterium]|jgi:hypothetical protein|nr:hypothetical protein [Chloroflexota bacterium]
MPPIFSRLPTIAGVVVMLLAGVLFLGQARMLPVIFLEEEHAFPYGPLAAGVGQSFVVPAPYLSRVTVTIDASGISTSGFPLNLRIRDDHGDVIAESRRLVDRSGVSEQAISFSPIADSKGRLFEVEIQPAEGAEGDIYLPMRTGSGVAGESFREQEGGLNDEWSVNFRLDQMVRPLTFVRGIFAADTLTGMGLLATVALLTLALTSALRSAGRVLGFRIGQFTGGLFAAGSTLAMGWAAYALFPVT